MAEALLVSEGSGLKERSKHDNPQQHSHDESELTPGLLTRSISSKSEKNTSSMRNREREQEERRDRETDR